MKSQVLQILEAAEAIAEEELYQARRRRGCPPNSPSELDARWIKTRRADREALASYQAKVDEVTCCIRWVQSLEPAEVS